MSLPDRLLHGTSCPRTVSSLWEETAGETTSPDERLLLAFVLPPWQRPVVWDAERQRAFVEGILLGFPPGAIVTVAPDWETGENGRAVVMPHSHYLIDGQQRVTAIREFIEGRLAVFDGVRYSDIPRHEQLRRFDRVVLTRIELPSSTDVHTLKALYIRMNYGGLPHSQEDLERVGFDSPRA